MKKLNNLAFEFVLLLTSRLEQNFYIRWDAESVPEMSAAGNIFRHRGLVISTIVFFVMSKSNENRNLS